MVLEPPSKRPVWGEGRWISHAQQPDQLIGRGKGCLRQRLIPAPIGEREARVAHRSHGHADQRRPRHALIVSTLVEFREHRSHGLVAAFKFSVTEVRSESYPAGFPLLMSGIPPAHVFGNVFTLDTALHLDERLVKRTNDLQLPGERVALSLPFSFATAQQNAGTEGECRADHGWQ